MKARCIEYGDGFAFERGLEAQGYSHDAEHTYRTNWHGVPVEVSIWSKSGQRDSMKQLLLRVGNRYELYKQADIGAIFDGDENDAVIEA
jgi:hypothetical protein